jgi:hypothetical protein
MAPLPDLGLDPTLQVVDAAIVAAGNAEPPRPYLGMSELGRSCERALWYGFRWCTASNWDAATLKRFEDGHRGEDLQAERLRLVPGIELHTLDPRTGEQFACQSVSGHARGHADGVIHGLLQAPHAWHGWEHKQTDEKKQAALIKAKQEHGEKGALAAWDGVYYAQAVLYLHLLGLTRHYLTCATPGGRHTVSVRTNADPVTAEALLAKAHRIITAPEPPARISDRPDWYQCQWCHHRALCHQAQGVTVPQVNCRTCAHATPELDGDGRWSCARYATDLPVDVQRQGAECAQHLFIPALLPWQAVNADEEAGSIRYQGDSPEHQPVNGPGGWHSNEIAANPGLFADPVASQIQTTFSARIL